MSYIEKEALLRSIESRKLIFEESTPVEEAIAEQVSVFEEAIEEALTADVVEVRHSRIKWVNRPISAQYATVTDENGEKHYGKVCDRIENNPVGYCGECGKRLDDTFMNYCPNCGAKMDGERKENGKS